MTFYRDLSYPFFDAAVLPRFDAAHLQMQAIDEESRIACGSPQCDARYAATHAQLGV